MTMTAVDYPELRASIRVVLDGRPEVEYELDESVVRDLASIAIRNGQDLVTAAAQAVANEKFLMGLEDSGGKLIIAQPGGRTRYLDRV